MSQLNLEQGPLKNIIVDFLQNYPTTWFKNFIDCNEVPNVPGLLKALPPGIRNTLDGRLKTDYEKYHEQFTYGKFMDVLKQYRPDLYEIAAIPYGERWFKGLWFIVLKYFRSL